MLAYGLYVVFDLYHLFLIAKYSYHVVACHDTHLRKERFDHLKMTVVDAVEHYGIDILKNYMLLYQCF